MTFMFKKNQSQKTRKERVRVTLRPSQRNYRRLPPMLPNRMEVLKSLMNIMLQERMMVIIKKNDGTLRIIEQIK